MAKRSKQKRRRSAKSTTQSQPRPAALEAPMLDVPQGRRLESGRQDALRREQARTIELRRENTVRLAAEERIKALLDRLVVVQEQERRRLAQNLHDQLGQQLTALKLTFGALKQEKLSEAERRGRFEMIEKIVAQLDRDVDFLAWELRPAALDDAGLEAALEDFVRQWSVTRGVAADFHNTAPASPRLPAHVESHLYRICQEALNNVAKHAHATSVSVLLEHRSDEVRLIVEDNGRGFDADAARSQRCGMGLTGIQERVASMGGTVEVESGEGRGTTLFVRIPLKPAPAAS